MIEKKRIGNLEFKKSTYLIDEPANPSYEIVLWYPNNYYGKESEYTLDESGSYYYKDNPRVRVSKSCFASKETCFSIASFDYDKEGYYEFHFVDRRPFEYSEEYDADAFIELAKYGDSVLNFRDSEVEENK